MNDIFENFAQSIPKCIGFISSRSGLEIFGSAARGTSQRCSGFGAESDRPKTLADRVHCCDVCGLVLDRDVNAARNVLQQLKGPGTGLRSRSVRVAA